MRIAKKAAVSVAGIAASGLLLMGAGPAAATGSGTCGGPAASLSAEDCSAFRADKAQWKAAKPAKPVFTPGKAAKAQRQAQREAFKSAMQAWKAQRDAIFAKYGLTAPVK